MIDQMSYPAVVGDVPIHDRLDLYGTGPVLGRQLQHLSQYVAVVERGETQRAQPCGARPAPDAPFADQHAAAHVERPALFEQLGGVNLKRRSLDGDAQPRPVRRDDELGRGRSDYLVLGRRRSLSDLLGGGVEDAVYERRRIGDVAALLEGGAGAEVAVYQREHGFDPRLAPGLPAVGGQHPAGIQVHREPVVLHAWAPGHQRDLRSSRATPSAAMSPALAACTPDVASSTTKQSCGVTPSSPAAVRKISGCGLPCSKSRPLTSASKMSCKVMPGSRKS